jgi:hypothetical protein
MAYGLSGIEFKSKGLARSATMIGLLGIPKEMIYEVNGRTIEKITSDHTNSTKGKQLVGSWYQSSQYLR